MIIPGSYFSVHVSDPISIGNTPLKAVTLTAVGNDDSLLPFLFDSTKTGQNGTGITTTANDLHQIWEYGSISTPTLTLQFPANPPQNPAIDMNLDTHFLIENGQYSTILNKPVPTENKIDAYTTEHDNGGFGNELYGLFYIDNDTSSSWSFAYLVVRDGAEVYLDFEIGGVDTDYETGVSNIISGHFTVPEPNVLLLLALGFLSMLVFARRRS